MATNSRSGRTSNSGAVIVARQNKPGGKRDWRISAILGTVWFVAVALVIHNEIGIPTSMLLIATIFFVLLIPSMNDLVRSMERYVSRHRQQDAGARHD